MPCRDQAIFAFSGKLTTLENMPNVPRQDILINKVGNEWIY